MITYNRVQFKRVTGAVAIAFTHSQARRPWKLRSVRLHLSAAATQEDLTISINSNTGEAYDVTMVTQDLTGVTNYMWLPNQAVDIDTDDVLTIAWANTDTRTYGLEIAYEIN